MYLFIYIQINPELYHNNELYLFPTPVGNDTLQLTASNASFLFLEMEYREERKRKRNGEGGMGDP